MRQAIAVGADGARCWGVAAWDPGSALYAGVYADEVMTELRTDAASALAAAHDAVPGVKTI